MTRRLFKTDDETSDPTPVERLTLPPLRPSDLGKIADFLVGSGAGSALAAFLETWSGGAPKSVAELLNYLWDEGVLVPRGDDHWDLASDPLETPPPSSDLSDLMARRFEQLPASPRRLLTVAAVLGQEFDSERLQRAEREDPDVVDRCVQLLLELWLIRQSAKSWSLARRRSDLTRWTDGARHGPFEFTHEELRRAVLDRVNPLRLQTIHRRVAASIRSHFADDDPEICEDLAYHDLEAGDWERSVTALEAALDKNRAVGAEKAASWYEEKLGQVLDRMIGQASTEGERAALRKRRKKLA